MAAPPAIKDFYYVLSQSWLPALKYHRTWKRFPRIQPCYWVLHGLWLNSDNCDLTRFKYERVSQFDKTKISADYKDKMDRVWLNPLPESGTDEEHRNHTLQKHGSCVIHYNNLLNSNANNRITTTEDYLRTATDLATQYNMSKYLRTFWLGTTHKVEELVASIKKQINVEPFIHTLQHENVLYLDQIYLYFDKELNLINTKQRNAHVSRQVTYLGCRNNLFAAYLPTEHREIPIDKEILPETESEEGETHLPETASSKESEKAETCASCASHPRTSVKQQKLLLH